MLTDVQRAFHWFPREMNGEKRAQKFYTGVVLLPTSGQCFFNQSEAVPYLDRVETRHQYEISGLVSQTSFRGGSLFKVTKQQMDMR